MSISDDVTATRDAILHHVGIALMDSSHASLTFRGHHACIDLTADGRAYLSRCIDRILTEKLSIQHAIGARDAIIRNTAESALALNSTSTGS